MVSESNPAIDRELNGLARLVQSVADCGEVDAYAGKRHTLRVSEGAQLEMTEDPSKKPVAVSMHNVSETGCAFWIKRKMELQSLLYLREFTSDDATPWMPAHVTHCTQGIRGFLIGVSFGEDVKPRGGP